MAKTKEINEGIYGLLLLGLVLNEHLKDGFQVTTDPAKIGMDLLGRRAELQAAVDGIGNARAEAANLTRKDYFELGHTSLDVGEAVTDVVLDGRPSAEVLAELKAKLGV